MIKTEKLVNFDNVFENFVLDAITDKVLEELQDVQEMLGLLPKQDQSLKNVRELIAIKIDRYVAAQESRNRAQKSNTP